MTLIEFIEARLDEDEAVARAAIVIRRRDYAHQPWVDDPDYTFKAWDDYPSGVILTGPERVLREVEAKRMLVEDHSGHHVCEDNMAGTVWDEKTEDIVEDPCRVLRIIGSIYADHPDYRTEWEVQP